jgi:hypothetical protein
MTGMWVAVLLRTQEAPDLNLISVLTKGLHGFIQACKQNVVVVSQILP